MFITTLHGPSSTFLSDTYISKFIKTNVEISSTESAKRVEKG